MTLPSYEVYAIRYAERDGRRPAHFVGGDPHDEDSEMAYVTGRHMGHALLQRPYELDDVIGIAVRLDAEPLR